MISSWPFVFRASSSSLANVSSLTLLCHFAEITEDTEGNQEDFTNAKEEAIDEEKAVQESEVRSWLRPEAGLYPPLDLPIDYCVLCEICFQRRSKFIRHVKTQIQEGIYKLSKLFSVHIIGEWSCWGWR